MDIHQLKIFAAVASCKGFSAASEKLHLSQSTVSAHIAALERELETQLIHRTTKTFQLTQEGQRLLTYANDILSLQKKAIDELSGSRNLLHIGTSSVPSLDLLPRILTAFREKRPDIHYQVICRDSSEIIQMVSDGNLDLGFVGTKTNAPCEFVPLSTDELVIATPNTPGYQEWYNHMPSPKEILQYPFLMRETSSGTSKEAVRYFSDVGISIQDINVAAYIDNAETLKLCIVNGLGISILSLRTVSDFVRQNRILVFPLYQEAFFRDLYIIYRKNRSFPQNISDFIHFAVSFKPTSGQSGSAGR